MAHGGNVRIVAGDGGGDVLLRAGDACDGRDGGSLYIRAGDALPRGLYPKPHPGDELLRFLAAQPAEMAPIHTLPAHLREPNALTVADADRLIEFGRRNHCFVGQELHVESGWDFGSITGPAHKPMRTFISEASDFDGDGRIRPHVRLTAEGRVRAARLASGLMTRRDTQRPATAGTAWRGVQRRLLELYERGERYTSVGDLAKRLGCGNATVQKAIKPAQSSLDRLDEEARAEASSVARKLSGWQARSTKARGAPRATSISGVVMDKAKQTREADAAKEAEGADWEIEFARLIEDAQPDERAKLNELDDEQRKELVAILREDPDEYERLLGRSP